ncbi:hypothetical protein vseg_008692 [Gypsophila vaccaria]
MDFATDQSHLELFKKTVCLAYQSLGVVYGDLSISPIYVYKSTFSGSLRLHEKDYEILGVLSLILWTLTLIPLCKYIIFVISADDQGEGGTFALYSLLCRHSKIGNFHSDAPASQAGAPLAQAGAPLAQAGAPLAQAGAPLAQADAPLAQAGAPLAQAEPPAEGTKSSLTIKGFFEQYQSSRVILLLVVLLGTSMVIGDGILSPTMSVLSAVSGMKIKLPYINEYHTVVAASLIVVFIFSLQHFGTRHVGFLFAPVLVAWLLCVALVGLYNIIYWNPGVIKAVSPYYAYKFFRITGKVGWSSLGGVVLCITGAEAMFADLGHFSQLSLKIAFAVFVYPCLILAYMGEAAYLSKHREDLQSSFYSAIPEPVFWPMLVIATLATIVASQAMISATFSIISQCRALKCFPPVKIVHTCEETYGRIYIPEANWMLMLLCIAVVIGFRDTDAIGNAYGLAAISVMFITTCLMFLIIIVVWKKNVILALIFVVTFGSVELLYMSSCLLKIHQGGWVPLVSSLIILCLMSIWKYGTTMKQKYEDENKLTMDEFLALCPGLPVARITGVGLVFSNVTTGIPPMFSHFVVNFPAFHEVLIFVHIETLLVPRVALNQRFTITSVDPLGYYIFRCTVRYGYNDSVDSDDFETQMLDKVEEFLESQPIELLSVGSEEPENVSPDEPPESSGAAAARDGLRLRELEPSTYGEIIEVESVSLDEPESSATAGATTGGIRFRDLEPGTYNEGTEEESDSLDEPESSAAAAAGKKKVTFVETSEFESSRFDEPESSAAAGSRDRIQQYINPYRWKVSMARRAAGVAYMIGNTRVVAECGSSLLKKVAINFIYRFLRGNERPEASRGIPHTSLIEIGILYHV